MQKLLKKQQGFTLLELVIVIVIISILALIGFQALVDGPKRARDTQRKNDLRNIKTALETYFTDFSEYPAATASLQPDYIKDVPEDPQSKAAYGYATTGTPPSSFTLTATLERNDQQATPAGSKTYTVSSSN